MLQIIQHFQAGFVPVFRFILCTFLNDHLQTQKLVHVFTAYFIHKGKSALGDLREIKRCCRWISSGDQVVQCGTEAVNITFGCRLPVTAVLFRRSIARRTQTGGVLQISLFKGTGCTKVDHTDFSVRFQHNIAGLHISVNNRRWSCMQVIKHLTQLLAPGNHIFEGYRQSILFQTHLEDLIQRFSLNIIHNDQERIAVINNIYDTGQILVVQTFENVCLHDQALLDGGKILCTVFSHLFDCPGLIRFFI